MNLVGCRDYECLTVDRITSYGLSAVEERVRPAGQGEVGVETTDAPLP